MIDIKTIYHGSMDIVKVPIYGHGKINNDYGNKLYWIGKVYNYVSYKYYIPCSKLIDLITVDDMLKQ